MQLANWLINQQIKLKMKTINNLKVDFNELYKSVFRNSDDVQLLTEVEAKFVRHYMKSQDKNDRQKNNTNKRET